MKSFKIVGYEVVSDSDLSEGRGRRVHVCYTSNYDLAKEIAKGRGVMGTDATVLECDKTIHIYDNISEWDNEIFEKVKLKALSKLTKEEQRILGLI